ncbi:unnamed protein product [Lymnaea stagnalis]|uniref:Uncharacterized protein n=1 Tax=Lymnaea stagnalis TaxID=6523 RepID=A0AAV2IK31_LYMST
MVFTKSLVTAIEMKFFENWRKLNKRAKIAVGLFILALLFLDIGVFTNGWATVKVSQPTTSAFGFNLDDYGYHSRSYTVGLSYYRSETAGDAAYYLLLIAILASVASFFFMDVHIVLLLMENRMDTVNNMLKFTIVSAFLGGIFAIIGIIIFAATFYHGDVVVNYSIFLTAIGAGVLLVGGEEAMKSRTEIQLVA